MQTKHISHMKSPNKRFQTPKEKKCTHIFQMFSYIAYFLVSLYNYQGFVLVFFYKGQWVVFMFSHVM